MPNEKPRRRDERIALTRGSGIALAFARLSGTTALNFRFDFKSNPLLARRPFFTSPRLRGEVASILRAGEGESQAGSDPRIVPFTRRLCFAPSPTSPRKRGEVNQLRLHTRLRDLAA